MIVLTDKADIGVALQTLVAARGFVTIVHPPTAVHGMVRRIDGGFVCRVSSKDGGCSQTFLSESVVRKISVDGNAVRVYLTEENFDRRNVMEKPSDWIAATQRYFGVGELISVVGTHEIDVCGVIVEHDSDFCYIDDNETGEIVPVPWDALYSEEVYG